MRDPIRITDVHFFRAGQVSRRSGVLGWVTFTIDGTLVFAGTTVRLTRDGQYRLSFPEQTDRNGRDHHIVRPLDDAARREVEALVMAELNRQGRLAS
jgi:DNA-binding cell septation regulator SpoVG